jgi:hypothetical protein
MVDTLEAENGNNRSPRYITRTAARWFGWFAVHREVERRAARLCPDPKRHQVPHTPGVASETSASVWGQVARPQPQVFTGFRSTAKDLVVRLELIHIEGRRGGGG